MTYKRILDVFNHQIDTSLINEIEKKWYNKYGKIRDRFSIDSVSDYWKKHQKDHALEQYVSIDFIGFNEQKSCIIGNTLELYARFKISPLKGALDGLNAYVRFEQKKMNDDLALFFYQNKISITDRILSPRMKEIIFKILITDNSNSETRYTASKIIQSLSVKEIRIDDVYRNNKKIVNQIPESIKSYLENKNPNFNNAYIDDVIHELIDESYVQEYKYRNRAVDEILRQKDNLAMEYIDLIDRYYYLIPIDDN